MGAGEQNRRMYAVIKPDDNNEMQNENPYDTIEQAKTSIIEDVADGNYDLEDVEIWEMRPIMRPLKLETAWENIL